MTTADELIARAHKDVGLGEPNYIQKWYAERNGKDYNYNFPWCNAAVTLWASESGTYDAVCFGTDYAYTVAHANKAVKEKRWRWGSTGIRRGDIAFIDWTGKSSIIYIDHVGIVTSVTNTHVKMIEGNRSDKCDYFNNSRSLIVGYIRPDYDNVKSVIGPGTSSNWFNGVIVKLPVIRKGSKNKFVGKWQALLCANGYKTTIDNDFGNDTLKKTKQFQFDRLVRNSVTKNNGDGIVGRYSWESGIAE